MTLPYLGPCVAVRRRADGTSRLRFEVRRKRPPGWAFSIPILVNGRDGCVVEALPPKDIEQIVRKAEDLYRQLEERRDKPPAVDAALETAADPRSWERLIHLRRSHGTWLELAPTTRASYESVQRRILRIFRHDPALAPSVVLDDQIDRLVRANIQSKERRRAVMLELRILIRFAMRQGWRSLEKDLLFYGRRPKAGFQIWTAAEMRQVLSRCLVENEMGLARLLVTQWEIGQRLRSVRNFRYGHEYRDGVFHYRCAKTGAKIYLEILDPRRRAVLDEAYREGEYMFPRALDGKPFTSLELCRTFARIRRALPDLNQRLQLRYLRHTVIVQLASAGCTVPEIASVTGHTLQTASQVLEHYLPRLPQLARSAQEKLNNRRQLTFDGVEGEMILENSRRVFLGKPPEEMIPQAPQRKAPQRSTAAPAYQPAVRL